MKKIQSVLALGFLAIVVSFGVGLKTAGELETISRSSATDGIDAGDVTGDGMVDVQDVIVMLEVAQGYREATLSELKADPNDNGALTVDDALRVLRTISSR